MEENGHTHEEYQYLNLVRDVIVHGVQRMDRTGVGTLSKFGCQMRYCACSFMRIAVNILRIRERKCSFLLDLR
jgi:thymidylate synthase